MDGVLRLLPRLRRLRLLGKWMRRGRLRCRGRRGWLWRGQQLYHRDGGGGAMEVLFVVDPRVYGIGRSEALDRCKCQSLISAER
jgi:hypothetical protein